MFTTKKQEEGQKSKISTASYKNSMKHLVKIMLIKIVEFQTWKEKKETYKTD